MGMRWDGGTAFPCYDAQGHLLGTGMTLRDYLAAHAPAEPWGWWEPEMPKRPELPEPFAPLRGRCLSLVSTWKRMMSDDCDLEDMLRGDGITDDVMLLAAEQWQAAYERAKAKRAAWDTKKSHERNLQWPYAYADMMLKERDRA